MLGVFAERSRIRVGTRFSFSLQRTFRVPDAEDSFPLPPGGALEIFSVDKYSERVPSSWCQGEDFFVPMHNSDALWIGLDGAAWKPNAVQVFAGRLNTVSGCLDDHTLSENPQNYIVVPPQPWLDGFNSGNGTVRQFVISSLGEGKTAEEQLTNDRYLGRVCISVFEPNSGYFPDEPPPSPQMPVAMRQAGETGIGAGGRVRQAVYKDQYGIAAWDQSTSTSIRIHILDPSQFTALTGLPPPGRSLSAAEYSERGLPWFEWYDDKHSDLPPSEVLAQLKRVEATENDNPIDSSQLPIQKLNLGNREEEN